MTGIFGQVGNDNLKGGAGNDQLFGDVGNDKLDGGLGNDTMEGNQGNDIYTVNALGDVVNEVAGGGIDTVNSSINYTLTAEVEKLTLTGAALVGTGNTLNNTLTGNGLANTLNGDLGNDIIDGKLGADTMNGGLGNDTYTVDNAGDTINEAAGQGTDTVKTALNYTLGLNLEKLVLIGAGAVNGTGNAAANGLTGNNSANVLSGLGGLDTLVGGGGDDTLVGGAQRDTLTGGVGADRFLFDNLYPAADRDTITDFASGLDRIVLDKTFFTAFAGIPVGNTINAGDFFIGAAAVNANQNIIYNNATGALYYDQDGSNAGFAQVQIAQLNGLPGVAFTDIYIAA